MENLWSYSSAAVITQEKFGPITINRQLSERKVHVKKYFDVASGCHTIAPHHGNSFGEEPSLSTAGLHDPTAEVGKL